MQPWLKLCWQGTRFCTACLASFCLWSLWLALAILLAFQIFIASSRELALPGFVLRSLEERLAVSGARVEFGRASFDPAGHVLIEQARLTLPAFTDPVVTAHSVYITLDLWALLLGRFEPRELQVSGASLQVPAMLSPTGRSEPLLHDLDFTLVPGPRVFTLPQLAGRLSTLKVTARGAFQTTPLHRDRGELLSLPALLARNYPAICRHFIELSNRLAVLEAPTVDLVLTPSATHGALVEVELLAASLKLVAPLPLEAARVRVATRLPLFGDTPSIASLHVTAGSVKLAPESGATGVRSLIRGRLQPDLRRFDFLQAEVTATGVSAPGLVTGPCALRAAGPLPALQAELTTRVLGEPLVLAGTFNAAEQSARFRAAGRFAPGLLVPLGQRLGIGLRSFIDFRSAPSFDLEVSFTPGWKFARLAGYIAGADATAYHVPMDAFAGHIEFDGRRFLATEAVAFIGDNFARGSFEQVFASREFRFLLSGRLHPPVISGWFREWWPKFWEHFDFTQAAPVADVDVRGRLGHGPETTVFVFADCVQPVINSIALDHVIARLFIRPHFYDVLEVFATRGGGAARGNFTRRVAPVGFALESLTFDFDSTLELPAAAGLVSPEVRVMLQPFVFAAPPSVRARGRIDGPAAPQGAHRRIHIEGRGSGAFSFHDFPLQHLDFNAVLDDDELRISPLEAGFAGGTVTGSIRLTGPEDRRRLGFTLSLREASLRDAATAVEAFFALRRGAPPAANSAYIERTAQVRMALDVSAEGDTADPRSFVGTGRADLRGQGLGRVRLLGLLSELLNFTALRFDTLQTDFKVERDSLVFPHVNLTGPDAAVTARGSYLLTRKELDFHARVFPFLESTFILKSVVGLVLIPLSGVLEVKLTGQLNKPEWTFVIGPTNFLRSIFTPPAKDQPVAPNLLATPPFTAP
jgi:hypothetical protein